MCNNARYLLYTFAQLCPHEDVTSSHADIFSLTCASLVTLDMHCDRPPKMEKSIWVVITVCSDHTKKFLGLFFFFFFFFEFTFIVLSLSYQTSLRCYKSCTERRDTENLSKRSEKV